MWRHLLGLVGLLVGPLYAAGMHLYLVALNRKTPYKVRLSPSYRTVRVYFGAKGIPSRYAAVTTGHRIYARPVVTAATMTHEMHHVRQIEDNGFIKNAAIYGYWHGRVGYNKNPLEQEARVAAGQPTR